MHFMNEAEIDMYAERFASHPTMGPATQLLSKFRDLVNQNSDGWAYWKPPLRAANKLITLIENHAKNYRSLRQAVDADEPTEADLKKTITPIKSFCTRYKLPFPELQKV